MTYQRAFLSYKNELSVLIRTTAILVYQNEQKFKENLKFQNGYRKVKFHINYFLRRPNKLAKILLESELVMKILPLKCVDLTWTYQPIILFLNFVLCGLAYMIVYTVCLLVFTHLLELEVPYEDELENT
jgi:hypothetical protein